MIQISAAGCAPHQDSLITSQQFATAADSGFGILFAPCVKSVG